MQKRNQEPKGHTKHRRSFNGIKSKHHQTNRSVVGCSNLCQRQCGNCANRAHLCVHRVTFHPAIERIAFQFSKPRRTAVYICRTSKNATTSGRDLSNSVDTESLRVPDDSGATCLSSVNVNARLDTG